MRKSLLCCPLVLGVLAVSCLAADGSSSGGATVSTDSVAVYSETASSSAILKHLAKGAALTVDYSIATGEGEWCSLGAPERGYVFCDSLKRDEPPKQDAAAAPLPTMLTPPTSHPAQPGVDAHAPRPAAEPAMFTPEQSALMSAAKLGSAAGIELALSKGALANGRDKDGKTALMWAASEKATRANRGGATQGPRNWSTSSVEEEWGNRAEFWSGT